jgi:RimJ/RimL family protein N-acetyltransferase
MHSLRAITDADLPFLLRLYATTRVEELAGVAWTDEQKASFITQQFIAQHQHWQENYSDTRWDLIEEDGTPIGRFYVARWPHDIRIVDIALLPEHRGRGIGTELIRGLFQEADATGRKISIHVEVFNPAQALYQRLGFEACGVQSGVYIRMERAPRPTV